MVPLIYPAYKYQPRLLVTHALLFSSAASSQAAQAPLPLTQQGWVLPHSPRSMSYSCSCIPKGWLQGASPAVVTLPGWQHVVWWLCPRCLLCSPAAPECWAQNSRSGPGLASVGHCCCPSSPGWSPAAQTDSSMPGKSSASETLEVTRKPWPGCYI